MPPGDEAAWTSPPFAAEIHDGVLYGRGAVDMKGGDRLLRGGALAPCRGERRHAPKGSLSLLITGDEEGAS